MGPAMQYRIPTVPALTVTGSRSGGHATGGSVAQGQGRFIRQHSAEEPSLESLGLNHILHKPHGKGNTQLSNHPAMTCFSPAGVG